MTDKGFCKQCGQCCMAIAVSEKIENWEPDKLNNFEEINFVQKNWVEISREEAMKIAPHKDVYFFKRFFYNCKKLVDGKCSVHLTKPRICSEYPQYKIIKGGVAVVPPGCAYENKEKRR